MTSVSLQSDHIVDIRCSNLYVDGEPKMTTLDYVMDMSIASESNPVKDLSIMRNSSQYT